MSFFCLGSWEYVVIWFKHSPSFLADLVSAESASNGAHKAPGSVRLPREDSDQAALAPQTRTLAFPTAAKVLEKAARKARAEKGITHVPKKRTKVVKHSLG